MKFKRLKSQVILLLAVTALVIFFGLGSQSVKALTISPIRAEFNVDPGLSVSGTFKLFNEKDEAQKFYITFARFATKDETGEPAFVPGNEGIPSWVEAPSEVLVSGKEYLDVDYKITVPEGAEPGGYFAAIFASNTKPPKDPKDIAIIGEAGTLIFLRVNGSFTEGETILSFNIKDKKRFFTALPVEFLYRFQNSGEDRVKPLGDIVIKNVFGITAKIINANRTAGSVLPKSIRQFLSGWYATGSPAVQPIEQQAEYPKNGDFIEQLKFEWNHLAIGYYSANLTLTVDNDSSRSYHKKLGFFVFPWHLMSLVALFLIFEFRRRIYTLLILSWLRFKKWLSRKVRDNE